jgi:hypothetical protein
MKKRSVKRGLYVRVTETTETDDEMIASLHKHSGEIEKFIADAQRGAEKIVRDAGIDPETLLQREVRLTGKRIDNRPRINWLDREKLPPIVDQALDILEDIELRVPRLDLTDKATRNGLWNGLRLATAVHQLNTNMAFEKPVRAGGGTMRGGRKGAKAKHGPKGAKGAKYLAAYKARRVKFPTELKKDSRAALANEFAVDPKTIERATKGH